MPNNYVLLETIALTQSAASVTFDNLPTSGYTDLKIVVSGRFSSGAGFNLIDFNGLSTANFSNRVLEGTGSSAVSFVAGNTNYAGALDGSGDTANTFSNEEIYIPNYRSSNSKSISFDAVMETNGTTAYIDMGALLWANSAAITSIRLTTHTGAAYAVGSTFSLYGIAAFGTTPVLAPKATGGNIVANDGTYWYHAFTSSGNFVPQIGLTADCLVIAGGGGGGSYRAGGGGAGGLLAYTSQSLTAISYNVTVGAGGTGATQSGVGATGAVGTGGVASQFGALTAAAGGGRGGAPNGGTIGGSGGSGGGSAADPATTPINPGGSASPSGQGNAGGGGAWGANHYGAGGGGGAGGAGTVGSTSAGGGAGGVGSLAYSSWGAATSTGQNSGGTYYYAGGGAGGEFSGIVGTTAKSGGLGGGGSTVATTGGTASNGGAATANTGGGGAGSVSTDTAGVMGNGGAGGSGIVIIRYPIAS